MAVGATPVHPGQHVRETVLAPKKLSVQAAAKLVGVGRPAFSNFLNGKVAATPHMASRIEHAFGLSAQELLDLQAAYDASQAKAKGVPANAMPYVVPFLGIKAAAFEAWVGRSISARSRLSVFLRTLVNSTGLGLTKVDFPGNDDSQRPGWDGLVDAGQATPWIPQGISGWEFGTDQDVKAKADGDFAKAVKASAKAERDRTTFVFVTPRHWPGKKTWVEAMVAKGQWRDVRAYDSSDLEQWLDQSIPAQAWFANETLIPSEGVRSLDRSWTDWAGVASPPLVGSLFAPAIEGAKRTVVSRLLKQPDEPTVVAADSAEEALAFLAQLFGPAGGEELEKYHDRVLVFDRPGVLSKLAQGTRNFIAVAASRDVERELGSLARSMPTIVVYPRNAANADPHVVLEPLNGEAFRASLEEMGCRRDDVTKYANESGRSLTVLRRRLSTVPAVRTPHWAADHGTAAGLIPFLLIGAWNSTNAADQAALTLLANAASYEELEKGCQRLAALDDAPLWSVGTYRGVISKIDLLFAVAGSVTSQDLKRYFDLAKLILGEDDPKLDLPEGDRWAAAIHGKSREFSAALRQGISETLVLLAVHGNHLFRARLGFDCELSIDSLVRELLTPLKARVLESNDRDLAAYAEAAPDAFLSVLEEDLKAAQPECYGLMRPAVGSAIMGGCPRTGLLWALESLAWSPTTLPRTALVLAQLAQIEIKDNWVNKPIASLEAIFRAWMPQTSADHETRLRAMRLLADKFPKVAWRVCIEQLGTGSRTGHYSYKPNWRNDGHGHGEPFKTLEPILKFMREMAAMAVSWKGGYSREMLCDLIEHLHGLEGAHQAKVWELVKTWAADASDADKAFVREKLRITMLSKRAAKRSAKAGAAAQSAPAKAVYAALEPRDILNKHAWLFREHRVEESADERLDEDSDYRKREARIAKLRTDALREVYAARGLQGIFELAEASKTALQVGWLAASEVLAEDDLPGFLLAALPLPSADEPWARKILLVGALRALQDEKRRVCILEKAKAKLSQSDFVRMLLLAPFRRSTWKLVDKLDEEHRQTYWNEVGPDWIHQADEENAEAVERLLAVQRPRAAFASVHFKLEVLGPELLFRLMGEMAKGGKDQPDHYRPEHYAIEQAFQILGKSTALTIEQKAGLEFAYIDALSPPWSRGEARGIPNLERYVELHPELFVQAVVWTYRRLDEGEDPPEWKADPAQARQLAERGYKLLEGLGRVPGHDDLGELRADNLASWVKIVREACVDLGRRDIADVCVGRLLSRAPAGTDGVWPCEPVRQVMESVQSVKMADGARLGVYNSRGVVMRGEDGAQERELAGKYRAWADALQYSHPFVASELLLGIVKMYERDANREDTAAGVRRRLR